MARLVSIVLAYRKRSQLELEIVPGLETEFRIPVKTGTIAKMGSPYACVADLSVSDTFDLRGAERRLRAAIPGIEVNMLVRFRDTWWRRYRWNVVIAVGGGPAVILIVELMRSSATRLYDLIK